MSKQPKEYNITLLFRLVAYSSEYTAVVSADSMEEAISQFIAETIEHNCDRGEVVRVSAKESKARLGPRRGVLICLAGSPLSQMTPMPVFEQPETEEDRGRVILVTCNKGRCLFCKVEGVEIVFVHYTNEAMSNDCEGVCAECLNNFQESGKRANVIKGPDGPERKM